MKTGAIIKYLPKGTTKEEIDNIRKNFTDDNRKLILIISGHENVLDNLCDFIKSRNM